MNDQPLDNEDFSQWEKIVVLGQGGNGIVWRVRRHGIERALKVLTNQNEESYRRFIDEVKILRDLKGYPGILPILGANLPACPSKTNPAWMGMPLAVGIKKALGERPQLISVVEAIAAVASTLADLADKGVCHRDVKPENLYQLDGHWVVGDFGLVDFPGKSDVTEDGRALGPRFYIAPEMMREPIKASGFSADVWSLAKTLWVLATGQNFPPPHPQPATDPNDALANLISHNRAYLLDILIERATRKEPQERVTMREFAAELKSWLTHANEPILQHDVSDLTNAIRQRSATFFDAQSRLQRSREQAELMTAQLLKDLNGLSEKLRETGLKYNEPQSNGGNLRKGSGFPPSDQGDYGVTVSMSTPHPKTHVLQSGVMIQALKDGRHRLYAAHEITHHGQREIVWRETHEADSGSCQEWELLNQVVKGLYDSFRAALKRFEQIMIDPK
jgi:serine/threonine protein kinase